MPMHIVPTPLTMIQSLRDNYTQLTTCSLAEAFHNTQKLTMELEEFFTYLFYQYSTQ